MHDTCSIRGGWRCAGRGAWDKKLEPLRRNIMYAKHTAYFLQEWKSGSHIAWWACRVSIATLSPDAPHCSFDMMSSPGSDAGPTHPRIRFEERWSNHADTTVSLRSALPSQRIPLNPICMSMHGVCHLSAPCSAEAGALADMAGLWWCWFRIIPSPWMPANKPCSHWACCQSNAEF